MSALVSLLQRLWWPLQGAQGPMGRLRREAELGAAA